MAKLLEISGLVKHYVTRTESLHILRGIDFSLEHEQVISITGESGSGKSTFLNLIGGLDNATGGSIKIEGQEITGLDENEITYFRNKKIGFIFQSHYLLEEFTALENVMLPYLMNDYSRKRCREKARYLLSLVGMGHREHHHPSRLSGGERQRVAIARSLINSPPLILADEPTGNLDDMNAGKVLELLFEITSADKHALLIVTHSMMIAKMAGSHYHLAGGHLERAEFRLGTASSGPVKRGEPLRLRGRRRR